MSHQTLPNSYDEVPYVSYAYPQTHPDHLATLATLSGMHPPPVAQCRVLELGCASGGNLIPMAYSLPHSEFIGIDLSAHQIAEGQAALDELGLKNVRLQHGNILDITLDFGQFDYIIVYGIYSWVPPEVQAKILEVCRHNLTPDGVAYVSYNVYPGWHFNRIIREAILYHTGQKAEPQQRIEQARAILDFLAETSAEDELHGQFLRRMNEFLRSMYDSYLFHDFMEEINEPVYFHQFIEAANRQGLQYLANAEFVTPGKVPPQATETLFEVTQEIVEVEQYLDFLTNRAFRETLLCRQEISLQRTLETDALRTLKIAANVQPDHPTASLLSTEEETFRSADGTALSTSHPLTKAAFLLLAEQWPHAIPFDRLVTLALSTLKLAAGSEAELTPWIGNGQTLAQNILTAYSQSFSLVELHTHVPDFVTEISDRPLVSATARYQLQHNLPITNLYHRRVDVDALLQYLIPYLDGSRDQATLLDILVNWERTKTRETSPADQLNEDTTLVRNSLEAVLEQRLQQLARVALLVG